MGKERRAPEVVQFVSADNAAGHLVNVFTRIQWKDPDYVGGGLFYFFTFYLFHFHFFSFPRTKAVAGNGGLEIVLLRAPDLGAVRWGVPDVHIIHTVHIDRVRGNPSR